MAHYFFHLVGDVPAHDVLGHDCIDDSEAKDHASFIAHRVGSERPEMIRDGNCIAVENERNEIIARIPLASTTA